MILQNIHNKLTSFLEETKFWETKTMSHPVPGFDPADDNLEEDYVDLEKEAEEEAEKDPALNGLRDAYDLESEVDNKTLNNIEANESFELKK